MADKDVEMKPLVLDTDVTTTKDDKPTTTPDSKLSPNQEIKANVALIQRGVQSMEPRFAHRVLRGLTGLRKALTAEILDKAIEENLVKGMYSDHAGFEH
jgi:26S proteasome regulatory subunit N3